MSSCISSNLRWTFDALGIEDRKYATSNQKVKQSNRSEKDGTRNGYQRFINEA